MSRANVELVRKAFEAFKSGGMEAVLPFYAPDVVCYPVSEWLEDPVYRGQPLAFGKRQIQQNHVDVVGGQTFQPGTQPRASVKLEGGARNVREQFLDFGRRKLCRLIRHCFVSPVGARWIVKLFKLQPDVEPQLPNRS